jgi:peptidyl-prolyl cis-trans isomerase A (cyclophilin A)
MQLVSPRGHRRNGFRLSLILAAVSLIAAAPARGTIVDFQTSEGHIYVRLFNSATPLTVANFLNYANNGRYNGTFIDRYVSGFVSQGGSYTYTQQTGFVPITPFAPVLNEPGISNLPGTIAMAKVDPAQPGGGPNSATSAWFFNLVDNASNLDFQNGGFTVFGRVLGSSSWNVVNQIQNYTYNAQAGVWLRNNSLYYISGIPILNVPPADYNGDGLADAADYTVWRGEFGATTLAEADGNGNARIDAGDYVLWRKTKSPTGGAGSSLQTGALPEPTSAMLTCFVFLFFAIPRRRRQGI